MRMDFLYKPSFSSTRGCEVASCTHCRQDSQRALMSSELVSRGAARSFSELGRSSSSQVPSSEEASGVLGNGMFSEESPLLSPAASVFRKPSAGTSLLPVLEGQGEVWSSHVSTSLTSHLLLCSGAGRTLTMGHCRLCHGKFSSRSLRSISERVPGETSERLSPGERVFIRDFQRLLGVAVHQDPALPQFVCKNCYTQFYQCHSLLRSFLQRVNVSPAGQRKPCTK